jgi:NADPH2:quinone reductase
VPPVDPQRLTDAGSVYLVKPRLVDYIATREALLQRTGELFDLLSKGQVRVEVSGRYSFEQAAAAHAALESRESVGKLLLIP